MTVHHLLTITIACGMCSLAASSNVGWKEYFVENPSEFHDLPVSWIIPNAVPTWLNGTYVRNGPAQISFGSKRRVLTSWLEGFAKVHSFKFNKGRILYSGKMLESPLYLASVANKELVPQSTFNKFASDDEEWTWTEKMKISWMTLQKTNFDNNNPALWRIGQADPKKGIYMAVTDSPVPTRFDIDTLSTHGMEHMPTLPMTLTGCAHWMREPGTDNSINIQMKMGLFSKPYTAVLRWHPEDKYQTPHEVARFSPKKISYFHSFSITENYVIIFYSAVSIQPAKMSSSNFHIFECLEEREGEKTDVYVVHLKTGYVTELLAHDLRFSLHHVNAYENGEGEIVLDHIAAPFYAIRDYLKLENMLNPPHFDNPDMYLNMTHLGDLTREVINLNDLTIKTIVAPDTRPIDLNVNHFDFPVINEEHRGKPYCIVYGWSAHGYSHQVLTKKNICDPTQDKVWHMENHYKSEVWFLPYPETNGTKTDKEDDGLLLTIVFDGEKEQSYLLLLDASTMNEVNRAYLPHNIPWSAHGMFFPEAKFQF